MNNCVIKFEEIIHKKYKEVIMKTNFYKNLFLAGLSLFIFIAVNSNAQLNWEKYEDNPVLEGEPVDWNENIFFSVVIHEDNLFKMWYCGWKDDSRQIGYAWSPDGIDWNLYEDPVIPEGDPVDWDFHRYPGTVLYIDDIWHMWYAGSTNSGDNFSIGYAWADEENVWNLEPDPVLEKGEPGEWDDFFVLKPSVYYDGTTFHMYYTGMKQGGTNMNIGYATSVDGINWIKDNINSPVITVGDDGTWYDSWVGSHGLIHYNDTLRMFYAGFDGEGSPWLGLMQVGYAWTTDYVTWNIETELEPALTVGVPGSWDEHWSSNPTVLIHEGYLKMWYSGFQNGGYFKIGYALGDYVPQ